MLGFDLASFMPALLDNHKKFSKTLPKPRTTITTKQPLNEFNLWYQSFLPFTVCYPPQKSGTRRSETCLGKLNKFSINTSWPTLKINVKFEGSPHLSVFWIMSRAVSAFSVTESTWFASASSPSHLWKWYSKRNRYDWQAGKPLSFLADCLPRNYVTLCVATWDALDWMAGWVDAGKVHIDGLYRRKGGCG